MRGPRSERRFGLSLFAVLDAFGHAHHIAHRDAAAFARQPIAAARAAHAFEDAGAHQLLHHLFQIALRHALARGDFLGLHRLGPRVEGDVDHRFQRQQGFAGEFQHVRQSLHVMPVEPKPPAPRAVCGNSAISTSSACSWRAITIWAILLPRVMRKGLVAVIDQDRLDLAAIVAVDGAGRIEHSDAVVERQARTRPHLRLVANGQFDGDAAGDGGARTGHQFEFDFVGGEQIEARGAFSGISGKGQIVRMRQALNFYSHISPTFFFPSKRGRGKAQRGNVALANPCPPSGCVGNVPCKEEKMQIDLAKSRYSCRFAFQRFCDARGQPGAHFGFVQSGQSSVSCAVMR